MAHQGTITIIGYYGSHNAGDIWLNKKTKQWIRHHIPSYTTILEHHCQNKWATFRLISQSDLVIFGGGSLFQDIGSLTSVVYYSSLILWAHHKKKPVYLVSHGIGPIHRKITKFLVKLALKNCHISVRDEASYTQLQTLGIIPLSLAVTGDLAYFKQSLSPSETPNTPIILVSLKPSSSTLQLTEVFSQLNRQNIQIQGLIADTKEDTQVSLLTLKNTLYWTLENHLHSQNPTLQATLLITMRYHAAVWASLHGIPFLAISDDPKLIALTNDLKQMHLPLTGFDNQHLLHTIDTLLNNHQNFQNKLIHETCIKIQTITHSLE